MPTTNPMPYEILKGTNKLIAPDIPARLNGDEPAVAIMQDFTKESPCTIEAHGSLNDAKHIMQTNHTAFLLVVNDAGNCLGILTLKDVLGKKAMSVAHEMGAHLGDLQAKDIMQANECVVSVRLEDLQHATVAQVMATFHRAGVEYMVISQSSAEAGELRGLISASKTAERLNQPYYSNEKARTFSDIVHAVHGHFN
ncbi:MAG: CBS domain-containing protein [Pseudomonadales bacterium]|nr:CBS domain-containing protein [Pseudomonadales bacterium]